MANNGRDRIEAATRALVTVLQEWDEATVTSFAVDLLAGKSHPYRIFVTEEDYPETGQVTIDD